MATLLIETFLKKYQICPNLLKSYKKQHSKS